MHEEKEKCFGGLLLILSDFSLYSGSGWYCYAAYTEQQTLFIILFFYFTFGKGTGSCERIGTLKGITRTSVMFHRETAVITVTSDRWPTDTFKTYGSILYLEIRLTSTQNKMFSISTYSVFCD